MYKVGVLFGSSTGVDDPSTQSKLMQLTKGLRSFGLIKDTHIQILVEHGGNNRDQIIGVAKRLIAKKPELLVIHTTVAVKQVQKLNIEIPVVFLGVSNPVGSGIVKSLSRPSGNYTGYQLFDFSITEKLVQIVHELVPPTREVILVAHKSNGSASGHFAAVKAAANHFDLIVKPGITTSLGALEAILATADHRLPRAYIFPPDGYFTGQAFKGSIALLAKYRAPAIFGYPRGAALGGLASYGPDHNRQFYEAADYVFRILRGVIAANLPVQQPRKFLFSINLKTLRSLGIKPPTALLGRADRIIE